jgi:hypothetical protein
MVSLSATVDQVRAEARQVDVAKLLLTLLLLPFFVLGWSARMVWRSFCFVVSFAGASARVGWRAAAPRSKGG